MQWNSMESSAVATTEQLKLENKREKDKREEDRIHRCREQEMRAEGKTAEKRRDYRETEDKPNIRDDNFLF